MGPLNRQMSLDEAYILLGVEGGAKHDDGAIIIAYNELVPSSIINLIVDWSSTGKSRRI